MAQSLRCRQNLQTCVLFLFGALLCITYLCTRILFGEKTLLVERNVACKRNCLLTGRSTSTAVPTKHTLARTVCISAPPRRTPECIYRTDVFSIDCRFFLVFQKPSLRFLPEIVFLAPQETPADIKHHRHVVHTCDQTNPSRKAWRLCVSVHHDELATQLVSTLRFFPSRSRTAPPACRNRPASIHGVGIHLFVRLECAHVRVRDVVSPPPPRLLSVW